MTPETPPRPARRTRPDSEFRKRALGLDGPDGASPQLTQRESLRNALSRIPDLERAEDGIPLVVPVVRAPDEEASLASGRPAAPTGSPEVVPAPTTAPSPVPVASEHAAPGPTGASAAEADEEAHEVGAAVDKKRKASGAAVPAVVASPNVPPLPRAVESHHSHRHIAPPPHPPWWRRLGFAVVLIGLVAAIPILGRTGYRLVTDSTDGRAGASGAGPNDPGYEELVTSTPTALVIQKDSAGLPVGLTFLSLSSGAAGGSVVFVPLDTKVAQPGYGVDRLRSSYTVVADDPSGATKQLADQTAKVLNIGVDEVIELDDRSWSQLVGPVSPVPFDNPEPVETSVGTIPSGPGAINADQMGPYLAAHREGEEEQAAFFRQEEAWKAWLKAVADSPRADAVPGETGTGIGLFARTLAKGPVTFSTIPGEFTSDPDGTVRFEPDAGALNDLMVNAVPAPDSPYPGARTAVRVLNGVGPGDIPGSVIRKVVGLNGAVTIVGNGPAFDQDQTTIIYSDPAKRDYALLLKATLGAKGKVQLDREAGDAVDVTVILGRDLLGDRPQTRSSSATSIVDDLGTTPSTSLGTTGGSDPTTSTSAPTGGF